MFPRRTRGGLWAASPRGFSSYANLSGFKKDDHVPLPRVQSHLGAYFSLSMTPDQFARDDACQYGVLRACPMTFKPTVLAVEPECELRWLGRLLVPGLFAGEHILHIEPLDQARSRFTQAERFGGILVGFFRSTLDKTELGFEQMNAALKTRAEHR